MNESRQKSRDDLGEGSSPYLFIVFLNGFQFVDNYHWEGNKSIPIRITRAMESQFVMSNYVNLLTFGVFQFRTLTLIHGSHVTD